MQGDDDDDTREIPVATGTAIDAADSSTNTAVDAVPAGAREIPIRESLSDRHVAAEAARLRDLVMVDDPGSLDTLQYGALPAVDINATLASQRASDAAVPMRDRAIESAGVPDALVIDAASDMAPVVIVNATIVSKRGAAGAEQERNLALEALRDGTEEDLRATLQRPRRPSDVPRRRFDQHGLPKLRSEADVRGLGARSDDDTGVKTKIRGNEMRGTINRRTSSEAGLPLDSDDQALLARLQTLPPEGREPDWKTLETAIRAETRELPMYRPWWQRWQYLVPLGALAATAAFALIVVSSSAKHAPERTSRLTAPRDAGTSEPFEAPAREHAPALWLDGEPFDLDEVEPSALDEVAPDPALESSDDIEDDAVTDPAGDDGILPVVDYGWLETLDDAAVARAESWLARKRS